MMARDISGFSAASIAAMADADRDLALNLVGSDNFRAMIQQARAFA
jgi:hypothetical protein